MFAVMHTENNLARNKDVTFWSMLYARRNKIYPWLYALVLMVGELLVALVSAQAGVLVHLAVLAGLLVMAALTYGQNSYRLYLALIQAPLIRILSLSLPLSLFPLIYWYLIVSFPLFAGAIMVGRLSGYRARDIGLSRVKLPVQVLVGFIGLPLGLTEYLILQPQPLITSLTFINMLLPALILLVCTGFLEELIFRGLIQRAAVDFLGKKSAVVFVSFIFAVLHITHLSLVDVFFVFGVAVLFTFIVGRTKSILGVTLAHGVTNITLYLIWPFIFN
jgi:hypothetical protein